MLQHCFLVLVVCMPFHVMGQAEIDSLRELLTVAKRKEDAAKIPLYQSHIGYHYLLNNQHDSALYYYRRSLKEGGNVSNSSLAASSLNAMGVIFNKTGLYDSSIYYYNKSLNLYNANKDTANSINVEVNLSILYKNRGLYEKSLENAFGALAKLEKIPPGRTLASCYNTIGLVYGKTGDFKDALRYHYESLDVRKKIGYNKGVGQSYNNIGDTYLELGYYDSALMNLYRALAIKESAGEAGETAVALNNIGYSLFKLRKLDEATGYFVKSLDLKRRLNDRKGEALTLNNLGDLKLADGDLQGAGHYLRQAEELIRQAGALDELRRNLELKVRLYKVRGDFVTAFRHAEELVIVKDSLLNSEKAKSLYAMQIRYETEKKEQQILLLEQRDKAREAQIEAKQTWIRALTVGLILVVIIVLLIYHNFRLARKSKRKVETLLKELHHRMKNNLQILSSIFTLQSQQLTDAAAIQAVKSSEGRVNAMALIHKKLYSDDQNRAINIKAYITELVQDLAQTYGYAQKDLKLSLEVEDIFVDVDKAIPIGLIINELVSNAFKYAYVEQQYPELNVSLRPLRNQCLEVEVSDNGGGVPATVEIEHPKSFGLKMVNILTKELRGRLEVYNENGAGFLLNIPVSHV